MASVLVLFYSTYGHAYVMAKAAAEGVTQGGGHATLKRVAETLPREVLEKMHAVEAQAAFSHIPVADPSELDRYDGFIFVVPTRFGNMPAQMKTFLDATGQLWFRGALTGKVGSVMVSTATQHGGQETTIQSFHSVLLHHGMVLVGLPYTFAGQKGCEEVKGMSPYGASTIAGAQGERQPLPVELDAARFQGKHVAGIAGKLAGKVGGASAAVPGARIYDGSAVPTPHPVGAGGPVPRSGAMTPAGGYPVAGSGAATPGIL